MNTIPWSDLAIGATVLLALGVAASVCLRHPLERSRAGAATAIALLTWTGLALVPLPRWWPAEPTSEPPSARVEYAARAMPDVERPRPAAIAIPIPVSAPPPELAAPPPVAVPAFDLVATLPTVWFTGALLAALALLAGRVRLSRILRRATPADPAIAALALRARGAAKHPPRVLVSGDVDRPFCCRPLRPTIVIPKRLCAPRLRNGLTHVLRHEIAHVRHGDLRSQLWFAHALWMFWWHPLLWWLRARTRFAAELGADDVAAHEPGAHNYARDLLEVVAVTGRAPRAPAPVLSIHERESEFSRRMTMLLNRGTRLSDRRSVLPHALRAATAVAVVVGCTGLWGRTNLAAQDPGRSTGGTTQQPASVIDRLRAIRVEHQFDETTLADVAKFYSKLSGVVFVLKPSLRDRDPNETALVDFELTDCPISTALDAICKHLDIQWRIEDGIVVLDEAAPSPGSGARPNFDPAVAAPARADWQPSIDLLADSTSTEIADLRALVQSLVQERDALLERLAAVESAGRTRSQDPTLDLGAVASLATRTIEARGEIEAAESDMVRAARLAEAQMIDTHELEAAERSLRLAKSKHAALRMLVDAEIEALEMELEILSAQLEAGLVGVSAHARLRRIEGYVRVLQSAR